MKKIKMNAYKRAVAEASKVDLAAVAGGVDNTTIEVNVAGDGPIDTDLDEVGCL